MLSYELPGVTIFSLVISTYIYSTTNVLLKHLFSLYNVPKVKESLTRVFSCKFCEISKSTFFHRTPPMAASDVSNNKSSTSTSKTKRYLNNDKNKLLFDKSMKRRGPQKFQFSNILVNWEEFDSAA